VPILKTLGYGKCRLSLAIPEDSIYDGLDFFKGKKIATSYPKILENYFQDKGIEAEILEISGSVEVTPKLNIADGICDIVSSGATLRGNNLREVQEIMDSESVLVKTPKALRPEQEKTIQRLLNRLDGVMKSQKNKYIMMNASKSSLENIIKILPGVEEPSIMKLAGSEDRVAIHVVCQEDIFWETMENLKAAGATSILVLPIEKMIC
jgi:ATP phosphoribosyltransferase